MVLEQLHEKHNCPSCCILATHDAAPIPSSIPSFRPCNLFAAGVVCLPTRFDLSCSPYAFAEDGWHDLTQCDVFSSVVEDEAILSRIDFLIRNHFVITTFFSDGDAVYIRIYMIPHDLDGVGSTLWQRSEAIIGRGSKELRELLSVTTRDVRIWKGIDDYYSVNKACNFLWEAPDDRTLSEIYQSLPSPDIPPLDKLEPWCSEIVYQALTDPAPPGMISTLYPYQRRTLARMLQQELQPGLSADPTYIPVSSLCKNKSQGIYYVNPSTLTLRQNPQTYSQPPSGVLCEGMGVGKTCIILALILSTISHLSSPEESPFEARPVLTDLSLRRFPSSVYVEAREKAATPMRKHHKRRIPSLAELCLHRIRATSGREAFPYRALAPALEAIDLSAPLLALIPFYHVSPEPCAAFCDVGTSRRRAAAASSSPEHVKKMYLTTATLVIVPDMLFKQWRSEVNKHVDGDALRVLDVDSKTALPRVDELATNYDLVLITHSRFSLEAKRPDSSGQDAAATCHCPSFPKTHIRDCKCVPLPSSISPLLRVRWKRQVIDEGHVCASKNELVALSAKLSIERRWIVSGTPTTNLMGLTSSQVQDNGNSVEGDAESESSESAVRRIWTNQDREDLTKLASMIGGFLCIPPFAGNPSLFRNQVAGPLLQKGPSGPQWGSIRVVEQVMKQVMIRHRLEDIEQDVVLPPLYQEIVYLDLDEYAIKTYNLLQAVIVINAVDSQRTGQDYLFHPASKKYLAQVIQNLSQTLFWDVDPEDKFDIDKCVKVAERSLQTAMERGMPESDLELVRKAIVHQRAAASDPMWRALMKREEVPFRLFRVPPTIQDSWLRIQHDGYWETHDQQSSPCFMSADLITALRRAILVKPQSIYDLDVLEEEGLKENIRDQEREEQVMAFLASKDPSKKKTLNVKVHKMNTKADSKEVATELDTALREAVALAERTPSEERGLASAAEYRGNQYDEFVLPRRSPLARARIENSVSTKLNFILSEVLRYSTDEKFLIFSASPLSLAYLAEALELVQVPFIQFPSHIKKREQVVVTFETSDKYRALLMELKHGARGLNLVTASRIIFCEPVWQADVESQAIKRAHRIGQKRPITVKTLAIRSTAEEVMINRKKAIGREVTQAVKDVGADEGVRWAIANPIFIEDSGNSEAAKIQLPLFPRTSDLPATEDVNMDAIDSDTRPHSHPLTISEPQPAPATSTPIVKLVLKRPKRPADPGDLYEETSNKKKGVRFL